MVSEEFLQRFQLFLERIDLREQPDDTPAIDFESVVLGCAKIEELLKLLESVLYP